MLVGVRRVVVLLVGSVWLVAMTAGAASADVTVHVTTTVDEIVVNGVCSLREAALYADTQAEPDCAANPPSGTVTISVPAGCYRVYGGLFISLVANSPVTLMAINGAGPGPPTCGGGGTVIDAEQAGSALTLATSFSTVAMSGVTLTGGRSCNGLQGCTGGGVENRGRLTLDDVLVTGNVAAPGDDQTTPGTGASGGNGGDGGGVFNAAGAQLTVTDSGIVGNAAGTGGAGADGLGNSGGPGGDGGVGGGIFNDGGSVALSNSTVSGNAAGTGGTGGLGDSGANPGTSGGDGGRGGSGGGIVSVPGLSGAGTLDLKNVTVAGNTIGPGGSGGQGFPSGSAGPGGLGGGIASTGTASLTNVTVAGNFGGLAGDGVLVAGGVMSEYGSLIAGNGDSGGQNCAGGIVNGGANITYPAQSTSDCPGVVADPKLGALGAHGGRVDTIALGPGSAAIDAEPAGGACPGTDARGVPRPQRAACDAGAYESAPPGLTPVNATATGPTTATVTADVDPHLRDTTVVVRFGPSASYGSSSQAVDAGSSGAAVHVSVPVSGLTPGASYHLALVATNADGTTSTADQTLTIGGAGARAPVLTNLRQSARRWLAGQPLATLARRRRLPVGTTFTFGLSAAATVTLSFTQTLPGRRINGRCVAPSSRNRRRPRCSRVSRAGSLALRGHAGADRVRFYGRLSKRTRLKPGSYTVAIAAVDRTGRRSAQKTLRFTIVHP